MSDVTIGSRFDAFVKGLNPAFLAIVMATGIVSLAVRLHGPAGVALALTVLNLGIFSVLLVFTFLRLGRNAADIAKDAADGRRAFGFFTTVAGANVLGVQALLILKSHELAVGLWVFAVAVWGVLTYGMLTSIVSAADKADWKDALNGTWLLLVVATQSCAVLGIQLFANDPNVLVACLFWFFAGCLLYLILITLIFYRLVLFDVDRQALTPPYWINMGALAISTLAGVKILAAPQLHTAPFNVIAPFIVGLTIALWCFASWWIPLLVALGLWRHGPAGLPLKYNAQLWAMVFPLGMYSVCSQGVAGILPVALIGELSSAFAWIALASWCVCFLGLVRHVVVSVAGSVSTSVRV